MRRHRTWCNASNVSMMTSAGYEKYWFFHISVANVKLLPINQRQQEELLKLTRKIRALSQLNPEDENLRRRDDWTKWNPLLKKLHYWL